MYKYLLLYITITAASFTQGFAQVVITDTVKELSEIIITKEKQTLNSKSGAVKLTRADILVIPSLLGSNDPLKALQTLPGIINGGDGNAGLYVRGGDPGQTQMLYNGITVYNPNHLFGLYSVFNPNNISSISLYKSAPPAWYGGRLSSFVSIESNQSHTDSLKLNIDAGLLLASVGIKTPVGKKTTVDVHFRKSYMNYTVWPVVSAVMKNGGSYNKIRYDFYDANIGVKHRLSANDDLVFSLYGGQDKLSLNLSDSNNQHYMQWGNLLAGLKWEHRFKKKYVLSSNAYYTGYRFKFGIDLGDIAAQILNRIQTVGFENQLSKRFNRHLVHAGIHLKQHKILPYNALSDFDGESKTEQDVLTQHVQEAGFFANDAITLSPKWFVNIGLRYTFFAYKGRYGTDVYNKQYSWVEPSLSVRYSLANDLFVRVGANINYQALQLIPVSTNALPIDFWISSNDLAKPSVAKQVSVGLYKTHEKGYEAYVDLFYKRMDRLMEYNGYFSQDQGGTNITEQFYDGSGKSYGAELLFKKTKGRLGGSVSYTFSRSLRTFNEINDGKEFPFKYDRPNQLVIMGHYLLSAKWSISALFTYSDGSTYTPEIARYMIRENIITEYGDYNSSRIAPYHRLDLSAIYTLKPLGKLKQELNFSVFNVYNRKNVLYNYYKYTGNLSGSSPFVKSELKNMAVLPVLPSVVYKLSL
ncbi:MAG: TonB-dependent receptor plug domain-containing protein [Agriterribacter sp.]